MLMQVSQEVATNGTVGQSPRLNGRDALQTMVDTTAKRAALVEMSNQVVDLQQSISRAINRVDARYREAREAFDHALEFAPDELELRPSNGTLLTIAEAQAEVTRVETSAGDVLREASV